MPRYSFPFSQRQRRKRTLTFSEGWPLSIVDAISIKRPLQSILRTRGILSDATESIVFETALFPINGAILLSWYIKQTWRAIEARACGSRPLVPRIRRRELKQKVSRRDLAKWRTTHGIALFTPVGIFWITPFLHEWYPLSSLSFSPLRFPMISTLHAAEDFIASYSPSRYVEKLRRMYIYTTILISSIPRDGNFGNWREHIPIVRVSNYSPSCNSGWEGYERSCAKLTANKRLSYLVERDPYLGLYDPFRMRLHSAAEYIFAALTSFLPLPARSFQRKLLNGVLS